MLWIQLRIPRKIHVKLTFHCTIVTTSSKLFHRMVEITAKASNGNPHIRKEVQTPLTMTIEERLLH